MTTILISFHIRIANCDKKEEATCIFTAAELLDTVVNDVLIKKTHRVTRSESSIVGRALKSTYL